MPGAGGTCNPSYSGGRDQEGHGLKTALANSFPRPYLKTILHKKRAGGVTQGVDPEFKPQYQKKKNKKPKNPTSSMKKSNSSSLITW
jgi:hypothetical protein